MLEYDQLIEAARKEIAAEYAMDHKHPWVVGFSGGKDSTLVTHLVIEHLMAIPRSERTRQVHIVANDTLVESPLVIGHIKKVQSEIEQAAAAFELPVTVAVTAPDADHTFWVNLIGRGYRPAYLDNMGLTLGFNTQAKPGATRAIFGQGSSLVDLPVGQALSRVRVDAKTRRIRAWE